MQRRCRPAPRHRTRPACVRRGTPRVTHAHRGTNSSGTSHVTAPSSQEQSVAKCLATIFPKTAHVLHHFIADDKTGKRAEAIVVAISKKTVAKRDSVVSPVKKTTPPKLTVAGGSRHHGSGGIFTTDRLKQRPWMTQKPPPKREVQKQQEGTDEHPK